jgi:hypothetical protein
MAFTDRLARVCQGFILHEIVPSSSQAPPCVAAAGRRPQQQQAAAVEEAAPEPEQRGLSKRRGRAMRPVRPAGTCFLVEAALAFEMAFER